MSPEMVPATLVPKRKAATKLNTAAQTTACAGVRTRVDATVEEAAQRGVVVVVADAFLVMDLDQLVAQLRELAALAQPVDGLADRHRRLHQHVRLLLERRLHRLDVEQREPLGQRVDAV